jgi:hypothetical protein
MRRIYGGYGVIESSVNGLKAHEITGLLHRSSEYKGGLIDESTVCDNLSIDRADVGRDVIPHCGSGLCAVDGF